jgi:hypothetical protein
MIATLDIWALYRAAQDQHELESEQHQRNRIRANPGGV